MSAPDTETDTETDTGLDPDSDGAASAAPDGAESFDGEVPVVVKRKTRRGSRGGKNRRKKPVGTGEADVESGGEADLVVAALVAESTETEPEHVPEPAVVPAALEPDSDSALPEESTAAEPDDPGYVPMSEWLDDFDRR